MAIHFDKISHRFLKFLKPFFLYFNKFRKLAIQVELFQNIPPKKKEVKNISNIFTGF